MKIDNRKFTGKHFLILFLISVLLCKGVYAMGSWWSEQTEEYKRRDEARDKKIEEYISKHPELNEKKKNMLKLFF